MKIVSAHRTPARLANFAKTAHEEGFGVIIAGAGGAAHLPGMIAAQTHLPVLGVPIESGTKRHGFTIVHCANACRSACWHSCHWCPGSKKRRLLAIQIMGLSDADLTQKLVTWRQNQTINVAETPE